MIKKWLVKCQVNMDASHEENIIVNSNTERKAKIKAEKECYKKGYFHVNIISCKELEISIYDDGTVKYGVIGLK